MAYDPLDDRPVFTAEQIRRYGSDIEAARMFATACQDGACKYGLKRHEPTMCPGYRGMLHVETDGPVTVRYADCPRLRAWKQARQAAEPKPEPRRERAYARPRFGDE